MTTAEMAQALIVAKRAGDTQNNSNCTFEEWMATVDVLLTNRTGIGHEDHVDWLWLDAYSSGDRPAEAVGDFMEENDMEDDGEYDDDGGSWMDDDDADGDEGDDFDADDDDEW